jgi:hypothetical protein
MNVGNADIYTLDEVEGDEPDKQSIFKAFYESVGLRMTESMLKWGMGKT